MSDLAKSTSIDFAKNRTSLWHLASYPRGKSDIQEGTFAIAAWKKSVNLGLVNQKDPMNGLGNCPVHGEVAQDLWESWDY